MLDQWNSATILNSCDIILRFQTIDFQMSYISCMLLPAPVQAGGKASKPAWTSGTAELANTRHCLSQGFSQSVLPKNGDLRPNAFEECWIEQCEAGLIPAQPPEVLSTWYWAYLTGGLYSKNHLKKWWSFGSHFEESRQPPLPLLTSSKLPRTSHSPSSPIFPTCNLALEILYF